MLKEFKRLIDTRRAEESLRPSDEVIFEVRSVLVDFLSGQKRVGDVVKRNMRVEVEGETFTLNVSSSYPSMGELKDDILYISIASTKDGYGEHVTIPPMYLIRNMNHSKEQALIRQLRLISEDIIPLLRGK